MTFEQRCYLSRTPLSAQGAHAYVPLLPDDSFLAYDFNKNRSDGKTWDGRSKADV